MTKIKCWIAISRGKKSAEFMVCSTRKDAIQAKKTMQNLDFKNIKIKKAVLIYD